MPATEDPSAAQDPVAAAVLAALPELSPRLGAVVAGWGQEVDATQLLGEAAEAVADLALPDPEAHGGLLARCAVLMEDLVERGDDAARVAVGVGFLDNLGPAGRAVVAPFLGPITAGVLAALADGTLDLGRAPDDHPW